MARLHLMKTLVNQRLTAAAEEIFGVFERTISQYEEEIHRQREMLDLVFNPEIKLPRADPPQLSVCEEEVPPEQQERSPSLGQEEPEPLQIKEEQEELWTSQEGEQLQGLEEADIIKFTSTPVPVKSEHDEETPQSSWFNQTQTEPLASTSTEQMKTEPDGEDCGLSEPASNLDPAGDLEPTRDGQLLFSDCSGTETEDSDDGWEPQSGLNTLKSKKTHRVKEQSSSTSNKFRTSMEPSHELKSASQILSALCCKVCGATFAHQRNLMCHIHVHLSGCGLCGKHLESKESLKLHLKSDIKGLACPMRAPTEQKVFVCPVCGKIFGYKGNLKVHMRTHTGEKPFTCIFCEKRFGRKGELKVHMRTHTGEKPYSCSVCGKRYGHKGNLQIHMRTHTGEKPFSCTVCSKTFSLKGHVQKHMGIHTGEQWRSQRSECRWTQRTSGGPSPSNTKHTAGWGVMGDHGQQ